MKKTLTNRAAGRSRGGKAKCPAVPSGSTPPSATTEYTRGCAVAFMEAAEECRQRAAGLFLGLKDAEALAVRELVGHFLTQASKCHVDDEL